MTSAAEALVKTPRILLNPAAIARVLGAVTLFLVLASVAGQLSKFLLGHDYLRGLVPLFYVDQEENIPSFFSMSLLLFASLLLAIVAVLERERKSDWVSKWAILSFGFLFMAYDEAFQVHEILTKPVAVLLGNRHLGIFHFAWVIPGIALVVALGLSFLRFLWHLPPKTRVAFVLAATLYLGGAIVFELVGGRYAEVHGSENLTYSMIATVEESLEMVGAIVFIRALLGYIADTCTEVRFGFAGVRTVAIDERRRGVVADVV
jgi:hypothetical protein